jgi:DNA-binding SARP family transcriptional activator/tetratricopeptide (TPR) repeat protein
LRLKTIGGLWIDGLSASQSLGPRQLALLAVVAAAGKKAISREQLIGILWPDTGEEQARHTLSQTLYSLRRDAGVELIGGTTQLRLNPALSSDIGEFQEAAAAGDFKAVGTLYSGRFLEGFYLPAAPEFERWVEDERTRLHQVALRAIERLAKQADESGESAEALRWWHRLADLDPLSARYTMGHMRSLAAVGDRSSALARARAYRQAVQRELDAAPDAAVLNLEQTLRAAGYEPDRAPSSSPVAPPASAPGPGAPPVAPSIATAPSRPRSRLVLFLVPGALLVFVAVFLLMRSGPTAASSNSPFLAVGEIRTESATDSTRVGPILRDMLATTLAGIEGLQVVANSRLVELMPRGGDTLPGAIHEAARRAGATELIEGTLTSESGGLQLSLRRVTVGRGVVRKGYVVHATSRAAVVDSATAAIARDFQRAPPALPAAEIRTSSPAAYVLYDEGLRAMYGYDEPAAYRLMKAALERDTTFAMAAYYVWQLSRSYQSEADWIPAMHRAERLALRTIERERLLIQGGVAEVEAPLATAVAIAETLTVKYPSLPDGHFLLGVVRSRQGDWAGSIAAFQRVISLDSAAGALAGPYCRICETIGGPAGMVVQYVWWDSAQAAERIGRRLIALRSGEPPTWGNLVEPLLREGRRAEAQAAFDKARPPSGEDSWPSELHRDLLRWGHYEAADRLLIAGLSSKNPGVRGDAWWLLLLSLRDQGRLREADTLIHRWRVPNTTLVIPHADPDPIDLAMLSLEMGRPEATIRINRLNADHLTRSIELPASRHRVISWYLTLAGTAYAAAGDTATVRRLADSVEAIGQGSNFGRDMKLHYVLRGLLLQAEDRHGEAVDAFRRSLFSLTDGYTRTNLMMARSLLILHRPAEAIAVLRPAIHGGVDGSNTYVSRTELHEALAQAFEQAGQGDSAVAHWRAVESAWRRADPQFHDRYLRAKAKAGL